MSLVDVRSHTVPKLSHRVVTEWLILLSASAFSAVLKPPSNNLDVHWLFFFLFVVVVLVCVNAFLFSSCRFIFPPTNLAAEQV